MRWERMLIREKMFSMHVFSTKLNALKFKRSCPINVEEAQGSQAIGVANSTPSDVTPTVTKISTTRKRDISVLLASLHF